MTAQILLVRHAAHSHLGNTLSGRAGNVPLSAAGHEQARRLAARLEDASVDEVQASPVRRAQETAREIAASRELSLVTAQALDEVDFGDWSGKRFDELDGDPAWHQWNAQRAKARAPGGESMAEVQQRVIGHIRAIARRCAGQLIVMVTHCDVIRAAIAAILGLSLDRVLRFDIDAASISRILAGAWGEKVTSLNERPA